MTKKRERNMPNKKQIDPNFQPSERVYELLTPLLGTIERAREFCGQELGEFIMYWEGISGKEAAKSNWNSTFLNRMKRVYEYKKESMALNRETRNTKQTNFFEHTLEQLTANQGEKPAKPFKPPPIYRMPKPPAETGEVMTQDQAFDELHKMFPGGRS